MKHGNKYSFNEHYTRVKLPPELEEEHKEKIESFMGDIIELIDTYLNEKGVPMHVLTTIMASIVGNMVADVELKNPMPDFSMDHIIFVMERHYQVQLGKLVPRSPEEVE